MKREDLSIPPPNYTQIPNILLDTLIPLLTLSQLSVLLVICRDTLGWHRQHTGPLSISLLQKRTGLYRQAVAHALKTLMQLGLIKRSPVKIKGRRGKPAMTYELTITEYESMCTS